LERLLLFIWGISELLSFVFLSFGGWLFSGFNETLCSNDRGWIGFASHLAENGTSEHSSFDL
jgi:hypothetical protein